MFNNLTSATLYLVVLMIFCSLAIADNAKEPAPVAPGTIRCGNLVYGRGKTSVCFSSEFLKEAPKKSLIRADAKLHAVRLDHPNLYEYPFCIMTGENRFTLTTGQRESMKNYLLNGGFVIASAGCSDQKWANSFRKEIGKVFPNVKLEKIDMSHPIFHTVYDIKKLSLKRGRQAHLEGLEIDGKIVLVFTRDGLNDSGKVSDDCCCCGGEEITNARQVNVNLLAYTLTH